MTDKEQSEFIANALGQLLDGVRSDIGLQALASAAGYVVASYGDDAVDVANRFIVMFGDSMGDAQDYLAER